MKGYGRMVALCLLFTFCEVACELVIPLLMSRIVDVGIPAGDIGYMARIGALMVGVAIIAICMGVFNARFSAEASQGFSAALRKALYRTTHEFSFSNIDKFSSASLVTRMTSDVQLLQNTIMMSLRMLTRAPIMLVSALFVAISINARLSMVIIGAIVLLVILTAVIVGTVGKLFGAVQKRLDAVNGTVQENLVAIRVVKAFVREGHERLKFKKVNDALTAAAIRAGNIVSMIMPMMMLVLGGTTIAVIWFGGQFAGGEMPTMGTGELMSFISYIMQILMSVMIFSMIFVMITRARASAERVSEVLTTAPDILDPQDDAGHRVTRGRVEFRDVCFRYKNGGNGNGGEQPEGEGENVLAGISFTAEPGEFVGIIGGTGSGKTSLVSLIPRFYDVTGGQVLVDGVDVRDYTQKVLRDSIGVVMQKNNLFSGTIKENLLWGNESAGMDEIAEAARDAQAYDFITAFPDGFDTELGQGGVNVSGGQKQRLCIARAMLKKPPILILDDSTSAVDTATEANIRRSFSESFKDSTVIIVAQRISSVKHADKIIVLDDGKISAIGTHEELLAANEVYREICHSQNEGSVA